MFLTSTPYIASVLGITALCALLHYLLGRRHKLPLPPGPKGIPILGNIRDMPKLEDCEWLHWLKHKDKYGPISSLSVLGKTFIIVNDAEIALKLLKDRAQIYAGRPRQIFLGEMYVWPNPS
jgi:hypothetical protein